MAGKEDPRDGDSLGANHVGKISESNRKIDHRSSFNAATSTCCARILLYRSQETALELNDLFPNIVAGVLLSCADSEPERPCSFTACIVHVHGEDARCRVPCA